MKQGNSPTFHLPCYPLKEEHREGAAFANEEHPAIECITEVKKKFPKRSSPVTVKRKQKKEGARIKLAKRGDSNPETEVDVFRQGEELLEYWQSLYLQEYGLPYEIGTKSKRLNLCDKLLESLKTPEKARVFMTCLLTHPEMGWCTQKTLEFLAKASNQSRIAPILFRRQKNRSRAEYSGERPTTTTITFRSI